MGRVEGVEGAEGGRGREKKRVKKEEFVDGAGNGPF